MGNECGEERDNGAGGKEWLTMLGVEGVPSHPVIPKIS
jgi:hypothetical protein